MGKFHLVRELVIVTLTGILITLSGCSINPGPQPNDPFYMPNYPLPKKVKTSPGAIYNPDTARFLLDDLKARRVGDVLMVQLTESTDASKSADTNLKKEDSVSMSNPILLGSKISALNGANSLQLDIAPKRKFKGESQSTQSNTLQGNISVTVVNILPNGYMQVRGEKWITLNQGREFIRLSGVVRPEDINAQNVILSSRIGNARIVYAGTGALDDANRQGWLSRFFSSSWWPF